MTLALRAGRLAQYAWINVTFRLRASEAKWIDLGKIPSDLTRIVGDLAASRTVCPIV
jgi:hypothetical protein